MSIIFSIIKGLLKTVVFWALVIGGGVTIWNWYKAKREKRTFTVVFENVAGLKAGSPIQAQGRKVGKVIQIYPLGNSNDIAVKGLITDKDFGLAREDIRAKIFSDIESGGGKVLEISHIFRNSEIEIGARKERILKKGQNPYVMKNILRIMKNFFQMSRDFAVEVYAAITSQQAVEYKDQVKNTVQNTITSLEYGTVKQDVQNSIKTLNKDIEKFERSPSRKKALEQNLKNKAKTIENMVNSLGSLSDVYKR